MLVKILSYKTKKSFMKQINKLDHLDLIHEACQLDYLIDKINEYTIEVKSNEYKNYLSKFRKLIDTKNYANVVDDFKNIAVKEFEYLMKMRRHLVSLKRPQLLDETFYSFDNYSNLTDEEIIKIIDDRAEEIIGSGLEELNAGSYNHLNTFLNVRINNIAIYMRRVYSIDLLNAEFLSRFDNAPEVIYGNINEVGPDYIDAMKKYYHFAMDNLTCIYL